MRSYISILIFLIGSIQISACSCGYLGGFVYSSQASNLVVYGTVLDYDSIGTHNLPDNPHSMRFLIKEKLRGIEHQDTIIIWGDDGKECRPYISQFAPNTEWILALDNLNSNGEVDYEISICGEFFVAVENGIVKGQMFGWNYKEEVQSYTYAQVRNFVQTPYYYPIQRPTKYQRETKSGLNYMSYCDILPRNTEDVRKINEIVCEKMQLPLNFMGFGDSYLLNAEIIIDEHNGFHFKGTFNSFHKPNISLIYIENQLEEILRNIGKWEAGYEGGKPVSARLIIPILLRK